jgi:hypothetical protein
MDAWAKPEGNVIGGCGSRAQRFGLVALSLALIGAVVMIQLGLGAAWRAALFVPFYLSAIGLVKGLYGV